MTQIHSVALAGGTHGNEFTGAYLVQHARALLAGRPRSFTLSPFLANPEAFTAVRRYLDEDMNRCFARNPPTAPASRDGQRAREIVTQYGSADFLIDLHTTTADMGNTLILAKPDPLSVRIAFAVKRRITDLKLIIWGIATAEPPILSSLCPGFTHEIGPVAQGVLHPEIFERTVETVAAILDVLDQYNAGQLPEIEAEDVYIHRGPDIDFPRNADGSLAGYIHKHFLNRNFEPLQQGDPLFSLFDGGEITYDGEAGLCPLFINEAAYYEKGIAFTLVEKCRFQQPE